ncbi:hypothetical protein V8F20_012739 [Naviculisporaceae sp. PSN 640]
MSSRKRFRRGAEQDNEHVECYLGIDLGSSGTRASIVEVTIGGLTEPFVDKAEAVENTNLQDRQDTRLTLGEFSSTLLLRGEDGATIEGEIGGQVRLSAKSAFYSMAELTKTLKAKYRHIEAMKSRPGRRLVKRQLRQALIGLLTRIKEQVHQTCQRKRLPLPKRVGLTVPADWDQGLLDAYQGIAMEIFDYLTQEQIVFCSETQALMHYVAMDCRYMLFDEGDCRSTVLVADFGGHTAGVVMYDTTNKHSQDKPFLREIGLPHVVEGGSNVWEDLFRNWREDVRLGTKPQLTKDDWFEVEQEINAFNTFKRQFNPHPDANSSGAVDIPVGTHSIKVDPAKILALFQQAFEGPLRLVQEAIRELKTSRNPRFLVSGLITENQYFRTIIRDMCKEVGLDCEPSFASDWAAAYRSHMISSGCAYVTADSTDVKTYLENNNVKIGVQFVQPYVYKDITAHALYSKATSKTGYWFEFQCDRQRVIRLVCCSTLPATDSEGDTAAELNIDDCYDLTPGTLKINATGTLRIRMRDDDRDGINANETRVILELEKLRNGVWKHVWNPVSFSLYYDASSNHVLLYDRHTTEEAAMRRLREGIRLAYK